MVPGTSPEPSVPASTAAAEPPGAAPPTASSSGAAAVKPGEFVELYAVNVRPKESAGLSVEYTPQARVNRLQGTIYLEVDIDETGAVTGARVVKGLNPDYGMGEALAKAARQMRYSPAIKEGVPVKTRMTFPVRLEIKK